MVRIEGGERHPDVTEFVDVARAVEADPGRIPRALLTGSAYAFVWYRSEDNRSGTRPVIRAAAERKVKVVLQTVLGVDAAFPIGRRRSFWSAAARLLSFSIPTGSRIISTPSGSPASSRA